MADESKPSSPREKVLGLDPLALLARAAEAPNTASILRVWQPPSVEDLGALLPQFQILALAGRGGMSAVYRARQIALDRNVAIKLLPAEAAADAEFAERFSREVRTLAKLAHPHIVTIFDSGKTSAGHWYFVMEYIDGTDLARLMASGEPIAPERAVEIVRSVCEALQFAHEQGIVHRDVKPANVLVARDGSVKVADFGLVRWHGEAESAGSRLTQSGAIMGTFDYMAPEQHSRGPIDARADIFSTGVVLYELLTGEVPRGAWLPPSRVKRVDRRFDRIVRRALAPDPAQRFASAAEFVEALEFSTTSRRKFLKGGAAVLTCLGVGAWWWNGRGRENVVRPVSLLADLDLSSAIVAGEWRWLDGARGETLHHDLVGPPTKLVRLPAQPGNRAYDLSFQVRLSGERSTIGVVIKTGATRAGLLFNYRGSCGLALIRERFWYENETTTRQLLAVGEWQTIEIAVTPAVEQVSVFVRVAGQPFLSWSGSQGDLRVYDRPADGWVTGDNESLAFASSEGGLAIRDVRLFTKM